MIRRPRPRVKLQLEPLERRTAPSVNVLAYDYGSSSTGLNANETVLTHANVNSSSFGKLSVTGVDGQVYAQPLVEQDVPIGASPGDSAVNLLAGASGNPNVVFVATEHASVYAVNAAPGSGAVLWQRSFINIATSYTGTTAGTNINNPFGASSVTTVPAADVGADDISPEIGITSTPVIDPTSGTLYVLVKTKEIVGGTIYYVQRLHAINVSDGTDRVTPFQIGATYNGTTNDTPIFVYGTGDGSAPDPNAASDGNPGSTIVQFNALTELNRPALSLENGLVYAAWASHGDNDPYHGWVVAWTVSGTGFQLAGWFCTSPNDGEAGIWMGGGALQFEPDGSAFYFETGNGTGGAPTLDSNGFPASSNYNEAVVKVVSDPATSINHQGPNGWGMKVADYFIPYDVAALDAADSDFGSGAPLLFPASAGIPGHPNLMVAAGKSGAIYLLDRDNLGKFDPINDNVINAVNDGSGHLEPPVLIDGSLNTPAYFDGKVYWVSGYSGPAYAYQIDANGTISRTSQTTANFGYVPGPVVVSADGTNNGIAWVMDRNLQEIHAYDAATFATELWNSNQAPGGGDLLGSVVKFAAPTVANGEVFVGTSVSLVIYGPKFATAAPTAPILSVATLSGSSINLTWTDASSSASAAAEYSIEESTDGVHFSVAATTPAGSTSVAIGGLQALTIYYFRIRGINTVGNSAYSNTASATTTNLVPLIDFSAGFTGAGATIVQNGTASLNGSALGLTDGNTNQASSAFFTSAVDITMFDTQFTFQISPAGSSAEGLTFTLQDTGPNALGLSGGGLGYGANATGSGGGIPASVAIKFDLNNNQGEGDDSTGLYLSGAAPTNLGSYDLTASGVDLHSGDVFQAHLAYNGTLLTEIITDTVTGASATFSYAVNIPSAVAGNAAYAGFTGSTGPETATQRILTWSFFPYASVSPNAPSGLGATAISATSILLNWTNNATNQTGFHLDRATDSNFTQNLITEAVPSSASSYTDVAPGLSPGSTYYYRVRAANGAGDSGNSNVAAVTIPLPPPAPTNQQITAITTNEIDLRWQDNAGHRADDYAILRAVNHGPFTRVATLPATSRTPPSNYSWFDTGLTPGTRYDYLIEALNVAGYEEPVSLSAATLTTAPTNFSAIGGSRFVSLSWAAVSGAVSYNLYRGASGAETLLANVAGASFVDTGVVDGSAYYYFVTALNINPAPLADESAPTSELLATPDGLPASTAGLSYSQTIAPTWGTGNIALTISNVTGSLPGLVVPTIGTNTLTFAGIPTAAGTITFTLAAVDATGITAITNYTIRINPPLAFSPSVLPGDTISIPYNTTIAATGGTGNVTLMVSNISGSIPGLSIPISNGSTLAISGTPTTPGTLTFKVTAIDSIGAIAASTYVLTVNPPLSLSSATLPADTAGVPYSQTISASGGTPTVALAVSNVTGSIPGITIPTNGTGALSISGTPTSPGTESFTVTASDASGAVTSVVYTINVNRILTLGPGSLPSGSVNGAYNQTLAASGGTGDKQLVVSNISGPIAGLLVPTHGANSLTIAGTPSTAGIETFTLTATDEAGAVATTNYSITINTPGAFLSIPSTGFTGATNSTLLNYPITISQLSDSAAAKHVGLASAALVLTYPTGVFGFPLGGNQATADVSLGRVPLADTAGAGGSNDWTLTANSPTDGKLVINLAAKVGDSITSDIGGGTLVTIRFPILPGAPVGTVPLTLINNASGHTQIVGSNGTYLLSPAPPYTGVITIVQGIQNPPLVPSTETFATEPNTPLSVNAPGLLAGATDPQGEGLSVGTVNDSSVDVGMPLVLASGAALTVNLDGSFAYTPPANYLGPDSFTFQAIDAGNSLSNPVTVAVNVLPTVGLTPVGSTLGSPGQTITEQVVLDNPSPSSGLGPLASFNLALSYDSGSLTPASVRMADDLPSDWTFTVNTTTVGVIACSGIGSGAAADTVARPAPLVLATLTFTINAAPAASAQINLVPSAIVGGQPVTTAIVGSGGTFPLNPVLSPNFIPGVDAAIAINLPVAITTSTLLNGTLGQPGYNQTISTSGGTGVISLSATGTLPPGLVLSTTGVLSGTPTALGPYTFTVSATDALGGTTSKVFTIGVYPPAMRLIASAPSTATAGTPFALTVTALNAAGTLAAGFNGAITLSSAGGLTPSYVTLTNGVAALPVTLAHAGTQTITASFAGLASGSATVVVSPNTFSQYLVAAAGPSTVPAGTGILFSVQAADAFGNPITTYIGPATVTPSVTPALASITIPSSVPITRTGLGLFLATMQQADSYTLHVAGGSFIGNAVAVTVTPGPPAKLAFAAGPLSTPTGVALPSVTVQLEDQFGNPVTTDNSDAVTVTVSSGPGNLTPGSSTTAVLHNGLATFNALMLVVPGSYTLSAVTPNKYTAPNSATFSVLPLQVVPGSFVGTPSGFALQFNAPILVNSATPILYGSGSIGSAPVPSVIVTRDPDNLDDTGAMVAGSIVVDSTTNTLTFLTTNTGLLSYTGSPVLADGVYTVIVHSSAASDGIQALNAGGGFLDGLESGTSGSGDYTQAFSVNTTAAQEDVLWVPAVADGPGQPLNGPGMNRLGGGYPVYLDDNTGLVTDVQLTLQYNPALLTVTPSSTDNFTVTVPTPGQAVLHYSGPALVPSLENPIGYITARVPSGTAAYPVPYKASDLLHLADAALNGGAIPTATSDALHLVAYVGDANGDGAYSSDDAVKITRVVLQADTGFAAYPLVDPVIVADTDGIGFIPADAALQANEAGVGVPANNLATPPIPHGAVFHAAVQLATATPELRLALPVQTTASGSSAMTAPRHVRPLSAHAGNVLNASSTAPPTSAALTGIPPVSSNSSIPDSGTRSFDLGFPSLMPSAMLARLPTSIPPDATDYLLADQRSWLPAKEWQAAADLALLSDPQGWPF
jgi:hypothetical protein